MVAVTSKPQGEDASRSEVPYLLPHSRPRHFISLYAKEVSLALLLQPGTSCIRIPVCFYIKPLSCGTRYLIPKGPKEKPPHDISITSLSTLTTSQSSIVLHKRPLEGL